MNDNELLQKYLYIIIILFNCSGSLIMLFLIIDSFTFLNKSRIKYKYKIAEPFQSKLLLRELNEPVSWFDGHYRLYGFN